MNDFRATYDVLANRWDDWSARIEPDVREVWARKLDARLSLRERVLELATGLACRVGRLLSDRYDYEGVDASPGMLLKARQAMPGVRLQQADMHAVNFDRDSLGGVVAFSSISHHPREQHAQLFRSIASWLRPGGVFIGNLHYFDDPDGFDPDWLGAGPMSWSGFDGSTNLSMLAAAGFNVVESEPIAQREPEGSKICPMWFVAELER